MQEHPRIHYTHAHHTQTTHTHTHYAGIDAAYLRQWTYGSCRVGIYAYLLNKFTEVDPKTGKKKPVLNELNSQP